MESPSLISRKRATHRALALTRVTAAMWVRVGILVLVCLPLSMQARAAGRYALVIGNKDYQYQTKLDTPLADARLIEQTLKALGFDVQRLENQKKLEMELAIRLFIDRSRGADVALFYYAGHGQQPFQGGRNYLLPVDAKVTNDAELKTYAVLADGIVNELETIDKPARLRLVILDACRSNPNGSFPKPRGNRGMASMQTNDQYTLVAFSTNDRTAALDTIAGSIHSPYAGALARWLQQANELPVRRIFDYTATDVRRVTAQAQQPRVSGDLPGDELMSGQMTPDDFQAWQVARNSNSVAALDEFVRRFPNSRYVAEAHIRIKALEAPAPQVTTGAAPNAPTPGQIIKDCDECPELVVLPTGSFMMGSPDNEKDREDDEGPVHRVTISRPIAVGRYEVTRGEFARFISDSGYKTEAEKAGGCAAWTGSEWKYQADRHWRQPGFDQGDDHPVVCVSWNDAQAYVKWLNGKSKEKPSGC